MLLASEALCRPAFLFTNTEQLLFLQKIEALVMTKLYGKTTEGNTKELQGGSSHSNVRLQLRTRPAMLCYQNQILSTRGFP